MNQEQEPLNYTPRQVTRDAALGTFGDPRHDDVLFGSSTPNRVKNHRARRALVASGAALSIAATVAGGVLAGDALNAPSSRGHSRAVAARGTSRPEGASASSSDPYAGVAETVEHVRQQELALGNPLIDADQSRAAVAQIAQETQDPPQN